MPLSLSPRRELPMPAVCAPLVGRTRERLVQETRTVAARAPDLLEWRVDFFDAIGDAREVVATARDIAQAAGGIPLLFTRRSSREGGEPIALDEPAVVSMYRAVCESACVQLVDFEMDNEHFAEVRAMSRAAGLPLVASFHNFARTPAVGELLQRFAKAHSLGADVAKIAVMPQSMADVLTLLEATEQASRTLDLPVVSMAMGPLGAVTRMCGFAFGSAMTFAVGESASAPGQMPIADVQSAVAMLRSAMRR